MSDHHARLVFDIETDGLYDDVTKIHSIVMQDVDTGEIISCTDAATEYEGIHTGLNILRKADVIIGHNIIAFDIPVIRKISPQWETNAVIHDTLVMARLYSPDIKDYDWNRPNFPTKLCGSHSLKAWGYRLGEYKDAFGESTDWKEWSPQMQAYCEQDVKVTLALYKKLCERRELWGEESFYLEHAFAQIIAEQERFGFCFDKEKAQELYAVLAGKREALADKLRAVFPPIEKGGYFIPRANNARKGYVKGQPAFRSNLVEFNPGSRDHIAERLTVKYGWKPEDYTPSGKPKIDETVLTGLPYEEIPLLVEYLTVEKCLGQLAEGNQAWLKSVNRHTGRIHGGVNTNGAVTGRCTHYYPNIAQVPAVGNPFGKECRSLFGPPPGYYQMGCDASGLELRCLAHYMAHYDGGAYTNILLKGDIHTENQKAAGLPTRDLAKRFIYGFLYGAGNVKLGSIVEPAATLHRQEQIGKALRAKFLKNLPALKLLIESVQEKAKTKGYLIGLDHRRLHVRSLHSALNLLLQSAGALVMKQATVLFWHTMTQEYDYTFGVEVAQMAHIHDEFQLAIKDGINPTLIGREAVASIARAGAHFNFRCPLTGECKFGKNWAETH